MKILEFFVATITNLHRIIVPLRGICASSHQMNLRWGTYGKDGKGPLRWVRLGECSTDHLWAILKTQKQITPECTEAITAILTDRQLQRDRHNAQT